eukprot:3979057-Amphidinium_carterae.1
MRHSIEPTQREINKERAHESVESVEKGLALAPFLRQILDVTAHALPEAEEVRDKVCHVGLAYSRVTRATCSPSPCCVAEAPVRELVSEMGSQAPKM